MAPVTRSSRHGPLPLPNIVQKESNVDISHDQTMAEADQPDDRFDEQQEDIENEEGNGEPFSPEDDDDDNARESLHSTAAQKMLLPLQEAADRVSRQVEEFAKSLDRYNAARDIYDQTLWEDAWGLLEGYQRLAMSQQEKTAVLPSRTRSSSSSGRGINDIQNQLEKLRFEADIWGLARHMLICNSPEALIEVQRSQESTLGDLHRYSRPADIWDAFLNSDSTGQEYEGILQGLQERASTSPTTIEDTISDLIRKAERGDGVWAAGSLFTKNAIKAQKRSRSWPKPLESSNPGLKASHTRASDGRPLTAQMDPDAHTREGTVLQPQDEFHEQAAWRACWELLKRGQSPKNSREWWTERRELWRAAVTRGIDPEQNTRVDSPWLRIMNIASSQEWCKRAAMLCQDGVGLDKYESAVYGIICGDESAALKVCETIDDHLFVIFNAQLITRYELYIKAYQNRLEHLDQISFVPSPPNWEYIRQYLSYSQTDERTRAESRRPLRPIEAALISKDFEAFFVRQGQAAAQVAQHDEHLARLLDFDASFPKDECAQATAEDPDAVRIIAHLQLTFKSLGLLETPYQNNLDMMENNIAMYIGQLEAERKLALLPLYASKLSQERIPHVLGPILIRVEDSKERDLQVKLMKQYKISIMEVLWGIFQLENRTVINLYMGKKVKEQFLSLTEYFGTARVKNIRIRSRFAVDEMGSQEKASILSMEWFRYINAEHWGRACWAAEIFYMTWLWEGRLNAARFLMDRASLADTSTCALGMNLNVLGILDEADEVDEAVDVEIDGAPEDEQTQSVGPSRTQLKQHRLARPGTSRELLASKSLVWNQLERLVYVIDCFEEWTDLVDELDQNREGSAQIRGLKRELEKSLKNIQEAISPLLEKDFLCRPSAPDQSYYLDKIRNHYLPEIILGYNSILYYAGHALSRTWLAGCMNLAQQIATNETLTNAFIDSKRMQELVTCFAITSQAMLHANEQGGKKGKKDARLEIWQVKFNTSESLELEALD